MLIRAAIETYFTEYRRYPIDPAEQEEDESDWKYSDKSLMDVLMGANNGFANQLNPHRISFYGGRAAKGDATTGYKRGVRVDPDGGGELFDTWGNHYRVIIDLDGDDQVPAPYWAKDQSPIRQGVIVWSPGPDGDDETEADNITTW